MPTPDCAVRVKEILLEHKSIYAAKTDLGKNQCVIEGVIEEKKLTEYIYQRTRKHCTIEKVEKTLRIVEEKVEVKKKKDGEVVKVAEIAKEKVKEVVAPYFIPCTHPQFIDYSHPWHRGGGDRCSPCGGGGGGYGCGVGYGYPCSAVAYTHSELKGYQDPNACSVM